MTTHDHGLWRERLALRLYGELDDAQQRELAQHLERCTDCSDYASELAAGLAAFASAPACAEIPPDWDASLRKAIEAEAHPARGPVHPLSALVGFAAGVVCMAAIGLGAFERSGEPATAEELADARPTSSFERDEAPPPAGGGGTLGRAAVLMLR